LNCPRCHAERPDVAHFCHVCGQDVRSDDLTRRRSYAAKPDEPGAIDVDRAPTEIRRLTEEAQQASSGG
jgi:predicted amidophosphoribosyltransferase